MRFSQVRQRRERRMATFQCYGENSFTFLFFQAIRDGDLLQTILLPSLRQFGTGRAFSEQVGEEEEADIWLFPNFGRGYGFGEPDALLLIGERSFWFEVETWLDFQTGLPALKQSMLQLARFHFFQQALARRGKVRRVGARHRAIVGPTMSNDGTVKEAVLKIKGHPVLQKIRQRLARSTPHYVLLCQGEPRGPGGAGRFERAMGHALQQVSDELTATFRRWTASTGTPTSRIPTMPPAQRCWYAYWNGYLDRKFRARHLPNPLTGGGYVGIR
jgi:hypothetical protein